MPKDNPKQPFPLGNKVIAAQITSLHKVLASPFTPGSIESWIKASAARQGIFHDTFFGCIRWPKSIGRSTGKSLADGFSLTLRNHFSIYEAGPDGEIIEKDGWINMPAPSMSDAADDDQHYRVNFSGNYAQYNLYTNQNELSVSIIGPWTNTFAGCFLLPNPLGYIFGSFDGRVIVLDPITVEQHLKQVVPVWSIRR